MPLRGARRLRDAPRRGREWAERQDPAKPTGVAISAWRHYRAIDGPLQSALLSLYMLVAVIPALLVMEEYLDPHPDSLASSIVHHYGLNAPTARLLHGVLGQGRTHELGSALLAIAGALVFGLGFGRVLQLVHARSWQLTLPARGTDQALYAAVLIGVYGLILLLLAQLTEIARPAAWVTALFALGWIALLIAFFVWAPWLLTHRLVAPRDLLPGAILTAVGLVALMLVSSRVMQRWVDLYAQDYGGFGVVLAIYFWLALWSALIVWAGSLSPALADRRRLRRSADVQQADGSPPT
jgi:membrane protein